MTIIRDYIIGSARFMMTMEYSKVSSTLRKKIEGSFLRGLLELRSTRVLNTINDFVQYERFLPTVHSSLSGITIDRDFIVKEVNRDPSGVYLGGLLDLNKNFFDVLTQLTDAKLHQGLNRGLTELLVNGRTAKSGHHSRLFGCLRVQHSNKNENQSILYVRFTFTKSTRFEQAEYWDVSFEDVTKHVWLSRELNKSSQKSELKLKAVMNLLRFERDLIESFLASTIVSLKGIVKHLALLGDNERENRRRIEQIFCLSHKMKGDAAVLGLDVVGKQIHFFEDTLSELTARRTLRGKHHFGGLNASVKGITQSLKEIKSLFTSMVDGAWKGDDGPTESVLIRQLKHLIKNLADEHKKRVIVVDDGYLDALIPQHMQRVIGQILAQLARNSVVHGIEDVATRMKRMKTPYGCFHVNVRLLKGRLVVIARDDGKGIDLELIRRVALKSNLFDTRKVRQWNDRQLMHAVFKSGFTTSKAVTSSAGRGVGLDVVKSAVERSGGKLSVNSVFGHFTEFTLIFPSGS